MAWGTAHDHMWRFQSALPPLGVVPRACLPAVASCSSTICGTVALRPQRALYSRRVTTRYGGADLALDYLSIGAASPVGPPCSLALASMMADRLYAMEALPD